MNMIADDQEHYDKIFEHVHLAQGEMLTGEFTDCRFVDCTFEGAVFRNCRFSNCTFQGCNLSLMQVPGCSFPSTRFEKSRLIGIDWTQGSWRGSEFNKLVGFFDCTLNHSTFIGLALNGIQIKNCTAYEVDFREADLTEAAFRRTDLENSLFGNTNLTGADLSQARNYQIDPGNNTLTRAKFSLPEAMSLLFSMDIEIQGGDEPAW